MIYLGLAAIWLCLGAVLLWCSWDQPRDYLRLLGGFAIILAVYNMIRWRMQVMMRRGSQQYQEEMGRKRRPPKVTDPKFDFSDPPSPNDKPD